MMNEFYYLRLNYYIKIKILISFYFSRIKKHYLVQFNYKFKIIKYIYRKNLNKYII